MRARRCVYVRFTGTMERERPGKLHYFTYTVNLTYVPVCKPHILTGTMERERPSFTYLSWRRQATQCLLREREGRARVARVRELNSRTNQTETGGGQEGARGRRGGVEKGVRKGAGKRKQMCGRVTLSGSISVSQDTGVGSHLRVLQSLYFRGEGSCSPVAPCLI